MEKPKCTAWLMALGKGKIDPDALPARIRCFAEQVLHKAGKDWNCPDAGSIVARELGALCKGHIVSLVTGPRVVHTSSRVVDFLLLLVRFLEPIAQGGQCLTCDDTVKQLKKEELAGYGLPESAVPKVWESIEGEVVVLDSRRTFFACQKRALQRLEVLAAQHCASPQGKGELAQASPSVAESRGMLPLPDLACRQALPRVLVVPNPQAERRVLLGELIQKIGRVSWFGGWIAVHGGLQVGKTVLLLKLQEQTERGFLGSEWRGRTAFVTADVPPDATPEEVEQGRLRLIEDLAAQLRVALPDEARTSFQRASALIQALSSRPALILVDNVDSAQVLEPLDRLLPDIVGVLATRSKLVANKMASPDCQIHLGGITLPEALLLSIEITGKGIYDDRQEQYITDLYNAVQGHALAFVILARAALRLGDWSALHSAFPGGICAEEARSTDKGVSQWRERMAREWQRLGRPLRRRLAMLGQLPFLPAYNSRNVQPLWGGSHAQVSWAFEMLADAGWLEPVLVEEEIPAWMAGQCGSGRVRVSRFWGDYRLPWLVWLFAQERGHELNLRDRVLCAGAAWLYAREMKKSGRSGAFNAAAGIAAP